MRVPPDLDLPLSREFAVIHGAKISLKSELGMGSEFKVAFPKLPSSKYDANKKLKIQI